MEDKRNLLEDGPFTYRMGKDGKLFISWNGKQIMILKGKQADKIVRKLDGVTSIEEQLILAKITGNFKRGNERLGKESA